MENVLQIPPNETLVQRLRGDFGRTAAVFYRISFKFLTERHDSSCNFSVLQLMKKKAEEAVKIGVPMRNT